MKKNGKKLKLRKWVKITLIILVSIIALIISYLFIKATIDTTNKAINNCNQLGLTVKECESK